MRNAHPSSQMVQSQAQKAVHRKKHQEKEAEHQHVHINGEEIKNVLEDKEVEHERDKTFAISQMR